MADPNVRTTQTFVEVETSGDARVTQVFVEVETAGDARTSQVFVEVETGGSADSIYGFYTTQVVVEVDVSSASVGNFLVSQLVIEADIAGISLWLTQCILEVDVSEELVTQTQDSFYAEAKLIEPIVSAGSFFAKAKLVEPLVQSSSFLAKARLEADRTFLAKAKLRKAMPTDIPYYDDFGGDLYEIRLLDHDGSLIQILDQYTEVEFTRAVNGQFHNGYGAFTLTGHVDLLPTEEFLLDRIIQVRRIGVGVSPVVVFEGLIRYRSPYMDDDGKMMYNIRGLDLKTLMKRRIILPFPATRAFFSYSGPFTDAMRYLVITNCTFGALGDRKMYRLRVQTLTNDGIPLNLNYRYTLLSDELDLLCQVGEGADWDVFQNGAYVDFDVFYPRKGRDRRRGSGTAPEMVWSLDRGNIVSPAYVEDRLAEWTVVYAGGEGIGKDRVIVERENIAGRQDDSPWNRIERFTENSRETALSSITAMADAALVEHSLIRTFAVNASPNQVLTYGSKWNLGDICTGEFYQGGAFDLRIVEVTEQLNRENGHVVTPTFFVYPRLEDY